MSDVGIFTLSDDLHAYIVADRLKRRHGIAASIVEVDRLVGREIDWRWDSASCSVPALDGACDLAQLGALWWRRARADQTLLQPYGEDVGDLINQDCRAALRGAALSRFTGTWISHPEDTERASFKIPQLALARSCGFRVPETLVSNDPRRVRCFVSRFPQGVVVKAVAGTRHILLVTKHIREKDLPEDAAIAVCPATYQEYVDGDLHLRVNAFGDDVHVFEIVSEHMDWRPDLTPNITYDANDRFGVSAPIRAYVSAAGLKMGIFDLKIDRDGRPVFFEINPQGQFLFLEGISGYPLGDRFAEFLARSLERRSPTHSSAMEVTSVQAVGSSIHAAAE